MIGEYSMSGVKNTLAIWNRQYLVVLRPMNIMIVVSDMTCISLQSGHGLYTLAPLQ